MAGMFAIAVIEHRGTRFHHGYPGLDIGELKLSEL
jgi:hypothetical protein